MEMSNIKSNSVFDEIDKFYNMINGSSSPHPEIALNQFPPRCWIWISLEDIELSRNSRERREVWVNVLISVVMTGADVCDAPL